MKLNFCHSLKGKPNMGIQKLKLAINETILCETGGQ